MKWRYLAEQIGLGTGFLSFSYVTGSSCPWLGVIVSEDIRRGHNWMMMFFLLSVCQEYFDRLDFCNFDWNPRSEMIYKFTSYCMCDGTRLVITIFSPVLLAGYLTVKLQSDYCYLPEITNSRHIVCHPGIMWPLHFLKNLPKRLQCHFKNVTCPSVVCATQ